MNTRQLVPLKGMLFRLCSSNSSSRKKDDRRRRQGSAAAASAKLYSARQMCVLEDHIAAAAEVIAKWNPEVDSSLFAGASRAEADRFLRAAADLHRSMLFFSTPSAVSAVRSAPVLRAHSLLSAAMRRLELELHLLLSSHGHLLNPLDSLRALSSTSNVSDFKDAADSVTEAHNASDVVVDDLRAVAEAMISAGYGKECVRVYKTMRKSFVDESIHQLCLERLTQWQIQKLEWPALDSKIQTWMAASPVAFRTLLSGERLLCDRIFAGYDTIRESCFADVTRESAAWLLAFPESVARSKRSPEKLFRFLDLYDAVAELWPDIESMFAFDSTASVRSQAVASLLRLAEAARSTLADFEAVIQRHASRSPVTGGNIHPLTCYVMDYLVFVADYQLALADIFADFPFEAPSLLPESLFDAMAVATPPPSAPSSPSSVSTTSFEGSPCSSSPPAAAAGSISVRIAWLVLVLICKLDVKAELYREVALSYLFLANNIQFIVQKVKESGLRLILGDAWVARHAEKARHYATSYQRLAWGKVAAVVPADSSAVMEAGEAWERMQEFNAALEAACWGQAGWVVTVEGGLLGEVRAAVTAMVVPPYRVFYEQCREVLRDSDAATAAVVRFSPEDVRNRVCDLFDNGGSTGSGSSKYANRLGFGSSKYSNRSTDSSRSE